MGEMLHHIIFWVKSRCLGRWIYRDHRILLPAPRAASLRLKHHVPINVGVHAVRKIVLIQIKDVFGIIPRIRAVSTFIFRLHVTKFRITLNGSLDAVFSGPLVANTFNILVSFRIAQHGKSISIEIRRRFFQPFLPRFWRINRSQPNFSIDPMLLERWSQIIPNEIAQLFSCPQTRWEFLIRNNFVLNMNLMNLNPFIAIGFYIFDEIKRIGLRLL